MFKGYNKDTTYANMQTGESPFARNIVVTKKFLSPSNEPGFTQQVVLTGLLIGGIATSYKDVLFIKNGAIDEIGIFEGTTYTCVVKGSFGFDINFPIEGTFKYNFGQQLIIAWTDNLNSPRILNVDCLPFDVNPDCTLVNITDSRLMDLTPELSIPVIDLLPHAVGGSVEVGAYWAFIAYEYLDGTRTNWVKMSNTILVTDNKPNEIFINYEGAEGGTPTNKIIQLAISNIDTAFSKIVLGIIRQRNGIQDAFIVNSFTIEADTQTIRYEGTETTIAVSIEELLVPNQTYIKAKTITSLDDRLYLGNVKTEDTIDWQQYANNVTIDWVYGNPFNLLDTTDSYENPVVFFNERTFRSDEVYDFYAVAKLKTGSYSEAFHIPGIEEGVINVSGTNFPQSLGLQEFKNLGYTLPDLDEYLAIAPDAKLYHLVNTAKVNTNFGGVLIGNMGFYQNEDVRYSDEACSLIKDCDGNVIGNLAGVRRRFHRFPSISQIHTALNEYVEYGKVTSKTALLHATGFTIIPGSPTTAVLDYDIVNSTLSPTINADASDGSIRYTPTVASIFRFEIDTRIFDYRNQLEVKIGYVKGGVTTFIVDIDEPSSISNRDRRIRVNEVVELNVGDFFFIAVYIIATGIYFGGEVSNTANIFRITDISFNGIETKMKRFGIRLNNLCIPNEIAAKIDHLEVFYAKRTFNNSTIVGQSLIDIINGADVRSYDFDLLTTKASVGITHINAEIAFDSGNTDFITYAFTNVINKIKQVKTHKYVAANVSGTPDNRKREEYLQLELSNITSLPNDKLVLANLKVHKRNLYQQVELIPTGEIILHNYTGGSIPSTYINTPTLYGGDTVISTYGHLHSALLPKGFYTITAPEVEAIGQFSTFGTTRLGAIPNPSIVDLATLIIFSVWFYPVESIFNIGLRHDNELIDLDDYFPKTNQLPVTIDLAIDKTLFPLIEDNDYYTGESQITYNYDFHAFPPNLNIQQFNCIRGCYDNQVIYPTRVARSIVSNNEEYELSWRTFLVNDYYEMLKDKGVIWKLAVYNQALIIHLEYSLYVALVKDRLALNIQEIFLGTGDIFDRRPDEIIGTPEGYAGCQSQWAAFTCKLGYVFIDLNQGKVFLFNGKLKELSNDKMRTWFYTNFTTNETLTDLTTFPVIDNPRTQSGAIAWYDEIYNRIMIGYTYRTSSGVDKFRSRQLSYYPDLEAWVSEHDYNPSIAYATRRGIFSVDVNKINNTSTIYLHNQRNYGVFYNNDRYSASIDVILKTPGAEQVRWDGVLWNSLVTDGVRTFKDETFTFIVIYTEDQCTGSIELVDKKDLYANDSRSTRNTKYTWKFSKIRDIVVNKDDIIITNEGFLNIFNLKNNPNWYELSKFYNNFIVVRFIYDNADQKEIFLNDLNVNIIKTRR